MVADAVVVAAGGSQVTRGGAATLEPGDAVVDVAVGGGHATAGEHTGGMAGLNLSALGSSGAAAGDTAVQDAAGIGVGDHERPRVAGLVVGDLTSDVGDHRSEPGQLPGRLGQIGQRGHIHPQFDPAGVPLAAAGEQVQQHIGAQLVHRPWLAGAAEAAGDLVDVTHGGRHLCRRQVGGVDGSRAEVGGFRHDLTPRDSMLVAFSSVIGIGLDAPLPHARSQLPGREPGRYLDDPIHHLFRCCRRQVVELVDDHPRSPCIDHAT